jgi:hypothetical protein
LPAETDDPRGLAVADEQGRDAAAGNEALEIAPGRRRCPGCPLNMHAARAAHGLDHPVFRVGGRLPLERRVRYAKFGAIARQHLRILDAAYRPRAIACERENARDLVDEVRLPFET